MKTLVVGLGNPILTDDGVGVRVAWELEAQLKDMASDPQSPIPNPQIDITEASVGGLRLMELMIGYEKVIIVDAFTNREGNTPGRIHRMTLADLRAISPTQHSASAHDTTLVTALDSARALGYALPDEVIIYAIEVDNVLDFSEEMSTAVAAAIPEVIQRITNDELEIMKAVALV